MQERIKYINNIHSALYSNCNNFKRNNSIVVQSLSDLFKFTKATTIALQKKINELPEDNILRSEKATEIINNIKILILQHYSIWKRDSAIY